MSLAMLVFGMVSVGASATVLSSAITLRRTRERAIQVRREITSLMNHPKISVQLVEQPELPPYSLRSRCPNTDCGADAAHLVMELTDTVAHRQCVECDHTWMEKRI